MDIIKDCEIAGNIGPFSQKRVLCSPVCMATGEHGTLFGKNGEHRTFFFKKGPMVPKRGP